jgi:hypothetical protein
MRLLFAVNEKTPVFPRHKKIGEPYLRFRISMARYRRSIASGDQRSHHCGNAVTINETVIISHLLFNRITVKISSAGMICIPHCRLCRCQLKNTICKTLQISMVTAFVFSPRPRCVQQSPKPRQFCFQRPSEPIQLKNWPYVYDEYLYISSSHFDSSLR